MSLLCRISKLLSLCAISSNAVNSNCAVSGSNCILNNCAINCAISSSLSLLSVVTRNE